MEFHMDLTKYFDIVEGHGVLATADAEGNVNAAEYAKPHFLEDDTIAFIMSHKRSYNNLQSNPRCAYIYIETGNKKESSSGGIRLYLSKVNEKHDQDKIQALRRKPRENLDSDRSIVFFKIMRTRPLVGDKSL